MTCLRFLHQFFWSPHPVETILEYCIRKFGRSANNIVNCLCILACPRMTMRNKDWTQCHGCSFVYPTRKVPVYVFGHVDLFVVCLSVWTYMKWTFMNFYQKCASGQGTSDYILVTTRITMQIHDQAYTNFKTLVPVFYIVIHVHFVLQLFIAKSDHLTTDGSASYFAQA